MKSKNIISTFTKLLFIPLLLSSASCDIDQPITNQVSGYSFWQTNQDALSALASCYQGLVADWGGNPFSSPSVDKYFGNEGLSDNAYINGFNQYEGSGLIGLGSYNNTTPRVTNEWSDQYATIKRCNILLENVGNIKGASPQLLERYKAEARFIRAWAHFNLVVFYGDVPLVTSELSVAQAQTIKRTSATEVIQFVIDELTAIKDSLPIFYTDASDQGRITRGAVAAFRARVNLYRQNWTAVVADCDSLIIKQSYGSYQLFPNYSELFSVANEKSNEIILALEMGGGRSQSNQRNFLPISVGNLRGNLVPTKELVDDYIMANGDSITDSNSGYSALKPNANRDPRYYATIVYDSASIVDFQGNTQTIYTNANATPNTNSITNPSASNTGYYFRKYYDPTAANYASSIDLFLIRYAEVLLMYAEAQNELGNMSETIWNSTVRALRVRAGFTDPAALNFPSTASASSLRSIIRRERRAELAFESLRAFDIKRWRIDQHVMARPVTGIGGVVAQRKFVAPQYYLWPIPQNEVLQNANLLPQNPGW